MAAFWDAIVRGLPRRVRQRLQTRGPHGPWYWILVGVCASIVVFIAGAIFEGEIQGFWNEPVRPWLGDKRSGWTATNWFFLTSLAALGSAFAVAGLLYADTRGLLGQLTQCQQERETIERDEVIQLKSELSELRGSDWCRQKELRLIEAHKRLDRELFLMMGTVLPGFVVDEPRMPSVIETEEVANSVASVFRSAFEIFGSDHHYRAAIYLPDSRDADYLTIKWEWGIGHDSKDRNRWYIGDRDPDGVDSRRRGIPGTVHRRNRGRAVANVRNDPDFVDPYVPPRPTLPYKSIVQAVIQSPDESEKIGVLAFDSLTYVFTDHDLGLIDGLARWLGILLTTVRGIDENLELEVSGGGAA